MNLVSIQCIQKQPIHTRYKIRADHSIILNGTIVDDIDPTDINSHKLKKYTETDYQQYKDYTQALFYKDIKGTITKPTITDAMNSYIFDMEATHLIKPLEDPTSIKNNKIIYCNGDEKGIFVSYAVNLQVISGLAHTIEWRTKSIINYNIAPLGRKLLEFYSDGVVQMINKTET